MSDVVDFVIVGAGVMGLCAALAVKQRGHTVMILESGLLESDPTSASPRVYALNLASQQLLQSIGIWEQICSQSAPYERMYVWDAQSSAKIDFDARMLAQDRLGVILEENCLKQALLQHIRACDIPVITQWQTKKLDILDNKIVLHSEQQSHAAGFLLIADGARSPTRELLKIAMTTWPYHQHALVAMVAVEKSHTRTAYQVFGAQGPLAFLPLSDPHRCSIVWSSAVPHIEKLMAISETKFVQELAQAFEHKLGDIQLLSARKCYPLQMRHVQQYVGERWAIMGDAAHTIHPLAGLGLNMGLADLTAFLALLDKQSTPVLTARALRAYQRQRKHELWQAIIFLQGIHRLFTYGNMPAKLLRRFGLNVSDRLPMLKRLFIEQASGIPRN
ncbi:MAG: FAD-dependent oxidoreductase [Legionellaceae bacterium]|nr:FAD-dependent oxidoreductase [Legionellaceae bacterium]MBP9775896.1 FAD-dependent oxidoreductase [Legionellaceae bacterium]